MNNMGKLFITIIIYLFLSFNIFAQVDKTEYCYNLILLMKDGKIKNLKDSLNKNNIDNKFTLNYLIKQKDSFDTLIAKYGIPLKEDCIVEKIFEEEISNGEATNKFVSYYKYKFSFPCRKTVQIIFTIYINDDGIYRFSKFEVFSLRNDLYNKIDSILRF